MTRHHLVQSLERLVSAAQVLAAVPVVAVCNLRGRQNGTHQGPRDTHLRQISGSRVPGTRGNVSTSYLLCARPRPWTSVPSPLPDPLIPGLPASPWDPRLRALSSCYWPCRCLCARGLLGTFCLSSSEKDLPGTGLMSPPLQSPQRSGAAHGRLLIQGGLAWERCPWSPACRPPSAHPRPHTDDRQVGTGSDAGDHVGSDALPLSVVLLAQGSELETPTGQGVVLASAGLPYLGQQGGKEEGGVAGDKRSHQHLRGRRRERRGHPLPTPPPSRSHPNSSEQSPCRVLPSTTPPRRAPEPRGTFLHVMTGKGSPAAAQGMSSSRPASCLYSQPGSTVKYGGS